MKFRHAPDRASTNRLYFVVVTFLLLSTLRTQAEGPFANGSFESPVFSPGGHSFPSGSVEISHWVTGGPGMVSLANGPTSPAVDPQHGAQHVDFNGGDTAAGSTLSQTFDTSVGQTYTVSFYVGRVGTSGGTMSLQAQATSGTDAVLASAVAVAPDTQGYGQAQTFSFTATTTNSNLSFTDTSTATIAVDLLLDNVSVTPVSECITPPSGLVSWWQARGDANDVVDGNHGVMQGGLSFGPGEVEQGFSFDGVNDFISVPPSASLNVGAGNGLTIECWIKPGDLLTSHPLLEWDNSSGQPYGTHFWISESGSGGGPGSLYANIVDTADNYHQIATVGGILNTNEFQHVALTYDKTTGAAELYYNGTVVAAQNLGVFSPQTTGPLYIGDRHEGEGAGSVYSGLMDEIGLYNRALGLAEIQSVYNAGSVGKCTPTNCLTAPPGLISWWSAEGDGADVTGSNPANPSGGITFGSGMVGQAFSFDGIDDRLSVASSPVLNVSSFTVESWVFPTDLNNPRPIFEYAGETGNVGVHLWLNATWGSTLPGAIYGNLRGPFVDDHVIVTLPNVIRKDEWQHIALTYDQPSGEARIYLDGSVVARANLGHFTPQTALPLNIGYRPLGSPDGLAGALFAGKLDELDLFNRALSQSEVQAIHRAAHAGKCQPSVGAFANGSFESLPIASGATEHLSAGSMSVTGWTVGSTGLIALANGPRFGINPIDGVQYLSFNGADTAPGGSISQNFSTAAGQTYTVGFHVGRLGSGSGELRLLAQVSTGGGVVLGSLTGVAPNTPGYGSSQTFRFTATTSTSTLNFKDISSVTEAVDLLLDNVSVVPDSLPPVGPFVNGSFESPALAPDASVELPAGSTTVTGWTVGNTGVVSWRNGRAYGVAPVDGFQEIGFNGADTSPGGSISQTFTTAIGQTYEVRFNVGRQGSGSGTMRLLAEVTASTGGVLNSLTAVAPSSPGYGSVQTFSFTATTPHSKLTFSDTSSATIAVDLLLDNVSVTPGFPPSPVGPFVNGSFELPALEPGTGQALTPGSNSLTAWIVGTTGLGVANGAPFGVAPVDGAQHIGFNGGDSPPGGFLFQTFSTAVGQTYTVRFYVGRHGTGSGSLSLLGEVSSGDGIVLGSLTGTAPDSPGYGPMRKFNFTATTVTSTITFKDTSSATVWVDPLLDNVSITPASDCTAPPQGLVGWWPGQGNAGDVVGGNDGTLQNATFEAGKVGEAFSFDGVNDYVSFGNTVGNFDTNDFTVEFWIRTASTRIESVIEKWPTCGVSSMWTIRIGGNGLGRLESEIFSDASGNNHNVIVSGRTINDGTFHHVAYVRKGANLAFYIDGVLDVSNNSEGVTRINNTAELMMGRSVCVSVDGTAPFTGQLDELSMYHRALSDSEIQAIYHAGGAGKCSTPQCTPAPGGLVDWWPGQGNAEDVVGSNNGTLQNGATFAAGKVGQAFSFDGVNDYVSFGNTVGNFDTNDFTVEFWVSSTASTYESVIEKWPTCGLSSMWAIRVRGPGAWGPAGRVEAFMISDSAGNDVNSIFSERVINDGVFHHVSLVRQGTNLSLYIDGTFEVAGSTPGITRISNSADLVAGRSVCVGADGTVNLAGQLDEISIYNRAVSAAEIQSIYNAGSAGKCRETPPDCVTPPSGLATWWPSNGNAEDVVGSNNGTLQNGATFAAGKVGQAFSFDGVNDYVSFGNTVGNFDTNDFTVEFWVSSTASTYESVIEKWPTCGLSSMWAIRVRGPGAWGPAGRVEAFMISDSAGNDVNSIFSERVINDGVFHHVSLVRQGTNLSLYIDGTFEVAGSTPGITRISNSADLVAGRSVCVGADGTVNLAGQLDEISIYNRALTVPEIQAIYNASSAGKCLTQSCLPLPSGLVSWWPFNGNPADIVGTNSVTLSGGPAFATGEVSETLVLDGVDDEARATASPSLNVGAASGFTIEAWINPSNVSQQQPLLDWNNRSELSGSHFWISVPGFGNGGPGSLYANLVDVAGNWPSIMCPGT